MVNEETPLLLKQREQQPRTPLPKLELSMILLVQLCEPAASQSINPYINQLVSELDITGGDEKKVGYYAGLIVEFPVHLGEFHSDLYVTQESLFFLTEAMTVLHWSRASDHIGRKPILLIGLFGTGLSIMCFGLSRTFWTLVVSRCLCGLLNGNIGVLKSAIGDLTDRTNRAQGFAFIPVVWALGASLGPLAGGTLARPHEHFPQMFSSPFWREFPYFLPCLATGSFVFLSCLLVLALFKETSPSKKLSPDDIFREQIKGPLPLFALLTPRVLLPISNYAVLSFLSTTYLALLPLFLSTPIPIGGLGLPPRTIGLVISAYGATSGVVQFFCPWMIERWGEKRVFMGGLTTCLPMFLLFPVIHLLARMRYVWELGQGLAMDEVQLQLGWGVWALVGCILLCGALLDVSFAAIFIFITASVPKSSRGTANGLSQTSAALARAMGPALSASLFAFSIERHVLGGYAVYVVFILLSGCALVLAGGLPEQVWDEDED
ncbi:major facilitator superfamily domain-containing protein [Roridomyces roridus]|uniref:Major facilitator superfamily domain-containing protein n=1 Tax=Roridomyces roridus TaxID=1738132 RepID=A0AAD7CKQ0_9AGAR|nr:major facilitator superfamily domain-containing protein [Roridomyces roridus]